MTRTWCLGTVKCIFF